MTTLWRVDSPSTSHPTTWHPTETEADQQVARLRNKGTFAVAWPWQPTVYDWPDTARAALAAITQEDK